MTVVVDLAASARRSETPARRSAASSQPMRSDIVSTPAPTGDSVRSGRASARRPRLPSSRSTRSHRRVRPGSRCRPWSSSRTGARSTSSPRRAGTAARSCRRACRRRTRRVPRWPPGPARRPGRARPGPRGDGTRRRTAVRATTRSTRPPLDDERPIHASSRDVPAHPRLDELVIHVVERRRRIGAGRSTSSHFGLLGQRPIVRRTAIDRLRQGCAAAGSATALRAPRASATTAEAPSERAAWETSPRRASATASGSCRWAMDPRSGTARSARARARLGRRVGVGWLGARASGSVGRRGSPSGSARSARVPSRAGTVRRRAGVREGRRVLVVVGSLWATARPREPTRRRRREHRQDEARSLTAVVDAAPSSPTPMWPEHRSVISSVIRPYRVCPHIRSRMTGEERAGMSR